jgi:hypothetical protein
MRILWKTLTIALLAGFLVLFSVDVSMFFWPSLPTSPRPAEGRIYPLNNHRRYTYMNRREYEFNNAVEVVLPIILAAIGAIYYFADPFDLRRLRRRY